MAKAGADKSRELERIWKKVRNQDQMDTEYCQVESRSTPLWRTSSPVQAREHIMTARASERGVAPDTLDIKCEDWVTYDPAAHDVGSKRASCWHAYLRDVPKGLAVPIPCFAPLCGGRCGRAWLAQEQPTQHVLLRVPMLRPDY